MFKPAVWMFNLPFEPLETPGIPLEDACPLKYPWKTLEKNWKSVPTPWKSQFLINFLFVSISHVCLFVLFVCPETSGQQNSFLERTMGLSPGVIIFFGQILTFLPFLAHFWLKSASNSKMIQKKFRNFLLLVFVNLRPIVDPPWPRLSEKFSIFFYFFFSRIVCKSDFLIWSWAQCDKHVTMSTYLKYSLLGFHTKCTVTNQLSNI